MRQILNKPRKIQVASPSGLYLIMLRIFGFCRENNHPK